tara:strand:+ start:414 stop:965 length:552 start_codon:yes stop_codon:yes gene_type:complete
MGGFRYFQKETGLMITGPHWNGLVGNVRRHREANDLPIDPGLEQEVEDYMCGEMPDGCHEVANPEKAFISISAVVSLTKILVETFLRGNPRVDLDEANRRAKLCVGCPDNVAAEGCRPCHAGNIEKLVKKLAGDDTTKHDAKLESCRHCGCFNKVQIWFPLDVLQKYQREAVRDALPSHCWKK